MNTAEIRRTLLQTRAALDAQSVRHASLTIETKLLNLPAFLTASRVALYVPTQGEIDLLALTTVADKEFYLPRVTARHTIIFTRYTPGEPLTPNRYGIAEPAHTASTIPASDLDLILLPLVAFDDQGHRVGRGSGYYDRTLAFMLEAPASPRPHLVGVAYEFQKVSGLIPNPWDVRLHQVITETQHYPGAHA